MPPYKAIHIAKSFEKPTARTKLVKEYVFANTMQNVKNNEMATMAKKNIGVLVVNWKFRALIENRQTKILKMNKEINYKNICFG